MKPLGKSLNPCFCPFSLGFIKNLIFRVFKLFELLLLCANTTVYCMQDYSERYGHEVDETRREVLFFLELGFNFVYVLVLMIKIMAFGTWGPKKGYFRSKFNVFNALVIFARFTQ